MGRQSFTKGRNCYYFRRTFGDSWKSPGMTKTGTKKNPEIICILLLLGHTPMVTIFGETCFLKDNVIKKSSNFSANNFQNIIKVYAGSVKREIEPFCPFCLKIVQNILRLLPFVCFMINIKN